MGVGLYLNGSYKPPARKKDPVDAWLQAVSNWFDEDIAGDDFWGHFFTRCRIGRTYDGKPALFVYIHPAGEDVEFQVPESGRVIVSTKTSTVGPGYHTALCRLMHRFGEDKKVRWHPAGDEDNASQDETGYFFSGDRAAVEEEMLQHLKAIARISVDTLEATGHTLETWHMPIGHSYDYPGGVRTPLGVRAAEWIRAVVDNPRNGIDIYPWWEEGLAPQFYLGRALCELWSKVRWRPVLTDEEYDDWDYVHRDLCHAYEADPSLDYPWREWAELIDILDGSEGASMVSRDLRPEIKKRAARVPRDLPLIGYRRYPVKVDLVDGWSIRIPGTMTEAWEEGTWSAWDGQRTVWFTAWSFKANDDSPIPAAKVLKELTLREGDPIQHRQDRLIGKAVVRETEEEEKVLQNVNAFSAVDGKAALCNIFYEDKADYDWAVATWHSLTALPMTVRESAQDNPEE
jgi:hypothetical protein